MAATKAKAGYGAKLQMGDGATPTVATITGSWGAAGSVTATAHGLSVGNVVTVSGVTGTDAATFNGTTRTIATVTNPNTVVLSGVSGTPTCSGGTLTRAEGFADLPEVYDITGPGVTMNFDDATHMESDNRFEEMIPTVLSPGTVTLQIAEIADSTMIPLLRTAMEAGTLKNFRLTPAGNTHRWSFSGYVGSLEPAYPVKGKMTQSVTIQVTGRPVYATVP